jgi:hypothetical protein
VSATIELRARLQEIRQAQREIRQRSHRMLLQDDLAGAWAYSRTPPRPALGLLDTRSLGVVRAHQRLRHTTWLSAGAAGPEAPGPPPRALSPAQPL